MFLKFLKTSIIASLLLLLIWPVQAQNTDAAKEYLNKAVDYYRKQDYKRAKMQAVKAISKDSLFADPYILLGNIFQDIDEIKSAILTYAKGYSLDSIKFKNILLNLATIELDTEQFSKALYHAERILSDKKIDAALKRKAERIIASAKFRKYAFMNPLELDKVKLKYVSHGTDEYINDISLDGTKILFTQKKEVRIDSANSYFVENIYTAHLRNDTLKNMSDFELPEEMQDRSGAASLSVDGRYLFFTVCEESANCELYLMSLQSPDKKVFNLGRNVNSIEWDSQPSFSADGKTLFFASKREGGYGGSDIWYSNLNEDGHFSRPKNAGDKINTSENEMAPFIHPDNHHLYFSSEGHPGMGGYDLFVSIKDSVNNWGQAKNLGYPLNTEDDEINMIVAPDGKNAYLSAKAIDFDLYHFELSNYNSTKVRNTIGRVFDSETGEALYASVLLYDLEGNELFAKAQSFARNGVFNVPLPEGKMFALHVEKEGYLFYSHNFHVFTDTPLNDTINVSLLPIKIGQKVSLKNIFFETDSYALLDASTYELIQLKRFIENNPTVKIEISGHTDSVGREEYNQGLSEKRAQSVYDYLIKNGVSVNQVSFKGYGETEPIDTNETSRGRAQNRRTEFKIIAVN